MERNKRLEEIGKELGTQNNILFTKSRILFLVVVFFVFSMPLIYRYFEYFLK